MAKRDANKLDVFLNKSLRRIMKIYWPPSVSQSSGGAGSSSATSSIRMDPSKRPKTALTWAPEVGEGVADRRRLGAELL